VKEKRGSGNWLGGRDIQKPNDWRGGQEERRDTKGNIRGAESEIVEFVTKGKKGTRHIFIVQTQEY